MTTVVASPPSFQPLSTRLGWNNNSGGSGSLGSVGTDDVPRMFMPQRKSVQRTNSSSSVSSTSSTNTVVSSQQQPSPSNLTNGDSSIWASKKKPRGGFWPASKVEPVSGVTAARPQLSTATAGPSVQVSFQGFQQPSPIVPSQQNGTRSFDPAIQSNESFAVLALLPLNGTFERKQINVPFQPGILKVGRQTNAKTVPTPTNGYFDSKVLSRAHAEVWADRNGKIWIRDVKSSNGTFINGHRLSAENKDSDPHELREHDTLELGIDINSEDQKSIVHHKVSAKIEFAGIPSASNGVLDLNFGDIDPSQGGGLLSSPLNQQMVHNRGRPVAPYNRSPASSIQVASQMSAMNQQRQLTTWGVPTGVDNLVKLLSNEMKTAKQQSQDLDQTSNFLQSLLTDEKKENSPELGDSASSRLPNGRPKLPRIDSVSRFSDPPAPPPRQPLPEKPDLFMSRSSPLESSLPSPLKRSDTAKPGSGFGESPTNPHSSQILSLVEALSTTKKDLEIQGARVKDLEEMLRQERSARQQAEERTRQYETHAAFKPTTHAAPEEAPMSKPGAGMSLESGDRNDPCTNEKSSTSKPEVATVLADDLQSRLDQMVVEMERMRGDMQKYRQRAETAEKDASGARLSLAEMIERLRKKNEATGTTEIDEVPTGSEFRELQGPQKHFMDATGHSTLKPPTAHHLSGANGHVQAPKLPEYLEGAMATVLRTDSHGQLVTQNAPYASMLGVILIGVGLMAYLNSLQKVER